MYRDTLFARNVYYDKVREHLPFVNNISRSTKLNENMESYINSLNLSLYPSMGISSMIRQARFDECFDTLSTTYVGPARDLLLSRLMYQAYSMGYDVPNYYEKKYRQYSLNRDYRKIVSRVKRSYDTVKYFKPSLPNDLITADANTTTNLDSVLERNRGKYIFIDFWATWCVPCLNDLPFLNTLKHKYFKDKILFLSISIDDDPTEWRAKLIKLKSEVSTNFLLVHPRFASILNRLSLNEIPRYILIDPAGKIINADMPGPSTPELEILLNN